MLKNFLNYFQETDKMVYSKDLYGDFMAQLGGKMFGNGLFNSFSHSNAGKWESIVGEAYPEFKGKFRIFGHDWLGRCFGIDLRQKTYGNVLMFEIGTGDVLEIPCSFQDFLNEEIPSYAEACLAKSFFEEWTGIPGTKMKYGRCAGYKIPLFLGGKDNIGNLEDSDMEVYWGITAQILNQV